MNNTGTACPLPLGRMVDEYFAESRNRLLELAAFFDRVERAGDGAPPASDFRIAALRDAAAVLLQPGPERVAKILRMLSDPTDQPLEQLDRKGAQGAWNSAHRSDGNRSNGAAA